MPLQFVPDPFDDDIHHRLDALVNKSLAGVEELIQLTNHAALLMSIVGHCDGVLDHTYFDLGKAYALVNAYDGLQEVLRDAWTRKSYRNIRRLAVLQGLLTTPNYVNPGLPDVHRGLSKSFEADFRGAAVEAFYEYLSHNMYLFKTENPPYFAKICPIIQSSGTGKSKVLLELCKKDVIVLYMNLREVNDFTGFPAQDRIPAKILANFPKTENEYRFACYSFFTTLFELLEEHLSTLLASDNGREDIKLWAEQMCSVSYPPRFTARDEFFTRVTAKYIKVRERMCRRDGPLYLVHLCLAFQKLCECLQKIFPTHSNGPMLVIAFDEAQQLAAGQGSGVEEYRPLNSLYEVANEYSHSSCENFAVWTVFASTASGIADFTPPKIYNGARLVHVGKKIFEPYTQLGWDHNALGLGEVSVEDIPKLRHISGYGRPLWSSLVSVPTTQSAMLETASSKLCGGKAFDPKETGHVLAVLGQRFELQMSLGHRVSATYVETGVVNHLRVCMGMTLDHTWKFTYYPSEPLLSCVAAHHLHHDPRSLETALMTLENIISRDMVELGQRGELTSRLLWLLAKDLYIRDHLREPCEIVMKTSDSDLRDAEVADCQLVPVVDWLEYVFGEHIWDKTQGSLVREHFRDAFLNFTHWIYMESTIAGTEMPHIELYEWTVRHWQRTSAVQCVSQEPLVDQMIPIYFKEPHVTAVSDKQRVSHIFIRNETRKYAHSKAPLSKFTRQHYSFAPLSVEENRRASSADTLPYITILADFGQPSELEVAYTENAVDDRCLRIYAAGINATTYPFLSNRPGALTGLEKLVQRQQIPETDRPIRTYLAAQFGFGGSGLPKHMHWEHGRMVPELPHESD